MCNCVKKLGRLRLQLGLLGLLGVTCVSATRAAATPAPTLFQLTIVGTANQHWSHTAPPVADGDCSRAVTSNGTRSATFRTKTPVTVKLLGGRVLPVSIGGIAGTVTLDGTTTTDDTCGTTITRTADDCAQTKRSFHGASVRLASSVPGFVSVAAVTTVRLTPSSCPVEPLAVRRRPLGPATKLLRLPKEALQEKKLARITLRSSRTQRTAYGSPARGRLNESARWTLTFVRIPG
jgi:hypothetical protein